MVTLIIGTNNSGKSALAEQLVTELAANNKKYYIATMIPFGEEGKRRVEKHRKMRAGKGFETLEWQTDIDKQLENMSDADIEVFKNATVLLECMSNLVGNEMYSPEKSEYTDESLAERILEEVKTLVGVAHNVVMVTNEFPAEDAGYDNDTRRYVRLTSEVNLRLLKIADIVHELRDGEWIKYENY